MLIFNCSLRNKILPEDWRCANVTAIYKKGSKTEVNNYRPVSLTSNVCKLLETFIRDRVINHFYKNKLFSNKQFGFLKGRSTVTQLLTILEDWVEGLEDGGRFDVIYTDLEKAFDKIPHLRLISKLHSYGLNGDIILWISAFLTNRKQRVVVNGTMSDWVKVLSGIPQGSILGPLLFIIFINDLVEFCGPYANIFLFADDAKLYEHIKTEGDTDTLQAHIDKFVDWAEKWLVKINYSKCKVMSIMNRGHTVSDHKVYKMKDTELEKVDLFKDLGVLFDPHLLFDSHISEKVSKAYMMLGIIKRNFEDATENCLLNLYKTMVRPHLEYANQVWHPRRIQDVEKLEKIQRKATKVILRGKKLSYELRLQALKLPTLVYRRTRGDMIEIYKIVTGKHDIHCCPKLNLRSSIATDIETRGNMYKLIPIRCRYVLRKNFLSNRVVNIWNSLPNIVVSAESVNSFKSRLDKFWSLHDFVFDYRASPLDTGSYM